MQNNLHKAVYLSASNHGYFTNLDKFPYSLPATLITTRTPSTPHEYSYSISKDRAPTNGLAPFASRDWLPNATVD